METAVTRDGGWDAELKGQFEEIFAKRNVMTESEVVVDRIM